MQTIYGAFSHTKFNISLNNGNGYQQHYVPLFPTSTRQHSTQVIAYIVHVTTQNSQQPSPHSYVRIHYTKEPFFPSTVLPYISYKPYVCISATDSPRTGPVLIILLIYFFQWVY